MAVTILDVIGQSLRDIGVLESGETPAAQDAADALVALNNLIDQWRAERLQIYAVTRTTATLTASQTSFTVGPSGNINIARPVYIDHIAYIDTAVDPDFEIPITLMTEDAWAGVAEKALTGSLPQAAYYEPTFPTGTLYPVPISTGASLLWAIYVPTAVAEFAAVSDEISLPPGYRRMIVKSLAVELMPAYGKQDGLLMKQAQDAVAVVKRQNSSSKPRLLGFDGAFSGHSTYSIKTGF